ncbi:MAG: recombinase family protein [Pyrinomonadaceae bacterium]
MTEPATIKSVGGIAPFGYRWQEGRLVVDEAEAPIRKLIYELFLKHCRKKTVAKLLNDLGYRTRNKALFSDTTIDRLLRDTTATGIRIVGGKEIKVEPIISLEIWERANNFLGKTKQTKQSVQLFAGIAFCDCGGKMMVPSNLEKYVCPNCRHKIGMDDLEEIFASQLTGFPIELGNDADFKVIKLLARLNTQRKTYRY